MWRLNVDGVLHSRNITAEGCGAYTQLFREGSIEAVRVFTSQLDNGRYNVASAAYETEMVQFLDRLKPELEFMGAGAPLVLLYSLIHADKAELGIDTWGRMGLDESQGKFDRAVILLPDIMAQDLTQPSPKILKPLFDLVWNAAGIQQSWNFDASGNWAPRR